MGWVKEMDCISSPVAEESVLSMVSQETSQVASL
jgi:hypothetical protein